MIEDIEDSKGKIKMLTTYIFWSDGSIISGFFSFFHVFIIWNFSIGVFIILFFISWFSKLDIDTVRLIKIFLCTKNKQVRALPSTKSKLQYKVWIIMKTLPDNILSSSLAPKSVIFLPKLTSKANLSSVRVEPKSDSVSFFLSRSFNLSFLRTANTSSAAPHIISRGCNKNYESYYWLRTFLKVS